jgi:hypothetical protein
MTAAANLPILGPGNDKDACPPAMTRHVGFLFLGPAAHIAHAATVAFELNAMPGYEATALVSGAVHAETIGRLALRYGGGCRMERLRADPLHRLLRLFKGRAHPRVRYVLRHSRHRLREFDALVSTDAHPGLDGLRGRPRMVLAGHGAGLRAHGQYPGMETFDLFLLPGRTKLERLRQMGYLDEERSRIIGYPKFDLAAAGRPARLFGNGNPVVLYNPHFNPRESSWPRWGRQVLDWFLAHPQYNLVFAPHVLLSAHARLRLARRHLRAANIHVDLDSPALIDMTYAGLADIYLGDISSQVYEFAAHRPRPCIFLDPHRRAWRDNPNLDMWRMGVVLDDLAGLGPALQTARACFGRHRAEQLRLVAAAFDQGEMPAGRRGALAIAGLLEADGKARAAAPCRPSGCTGRTSAAARTA